MTQRDSFPDRPVLETGRYRHYKGGEYEVVCLACDELTHEWLVVYKARYDTHGAPNVWVRTYTAFTETVDVGCNVVKRFERVEYN